MGHLRPIRLRQWARPALSLRWKHYPAELSAPKRGIQAEQGLDITKEKAYAVMACRSFLIVSENELHHLGVLGMTNRLPLEVKL